MKSSVLTVSELCVRWKCTRHTVLAKIHSGELRAFRLGERAFRVTLDEVLRFEQGEGKAA